MNSEEVHKQDTARSIGFLRVSYGDGISSRTAVPCCNWCHYQPVKDISQLCRVVIVTGAIINWHKIPVSYAML